jgi:hypothetical protein
VDDWPAGFLAVVVVEEFLFFELLLRRHRDSQGEKSVSVIERVVSREISKYYYES